MNDLSYFRNHVSLIILWSYFDCNFLNCNYIIELNNYYYPNIICIPLCLIAFNDLVKSLCWHRNKSKIITRYSRNQVQHEWGNNSVDFHAQRTYTVCCAIWSMTTNVRDWRSAFRCFRVTNRRIFSIVFWHAMRNE